MTMKPYQHRAHEDLLVEGDFGDLEARLELLRRVEHAVLYESEVFDFLGVWSMDDLDDERARWRAVLFAAVGKVRETIRLLRPKPGDKGMLHDVRVDPEAESFTFFVRHDAGRVNWIEYPPRAGSSTILADTEDREPDWRTRRRNRVEPSEFVRTDIEARVKSILYTTVSRARTEWTYGCPAIRARIVEECRERIRKAGIRNPHLLLAVSGILSVMKDSEPTADEFLILLEIIDYVRSLRDVVLKKES